MKHYYTTNPPLEMTEGSEALTQLQADVARFAEEGPDKPFLDVWFENESTGYVVGLFNLIFRTSDGGKSWTPLFDRTENARLLHFYAVHPVDDDLYLTGEQGMVLRLDKKSQRFQAVSIDYKGTFFGITNAGPSILVFGLRGNVFRSEDRGTRWRKVDTGIAVAITAAHPDHRRACRVGQPGLVTYWYPRMTVNRLPRQTSNEYLPAHWFPWPRSSS
jgi:photosystem II stability/assembly factor-like uncharacterized protein